MKAGRGVSSARAWALCAVLSASALLGYSGTNARLIGPPLGESIGQDVRAWVRAASDIRAGRPLYARSIEFGLEPDMRKYLAWDEGASYYVYPPLLALVMVPFVPVVSEDGVIDLWVGVSLALLAATALMMVHVAIGVHPFGAPVWSLLSLILVLTYYQTQNVLTTGNVDALLLFLVVLTYLLYRHRVPLAAVTFAAAVAVKPQLALLSVFFLWKREWRLVVVAGLTAVGLLVVGFSVVGWHEFGDYMEVNRIYTTGKAMRAYPINQAPFGLALRAFTANGYIEPAAVWPRLAQLVPAAIGLAAAAGWLIATSRADNRGTRLNLIEFGLTVTTMTLLLPYFGENQVLWLLLPLSGLFLVSTSAVRPHLRPGFTGLTLLLVVYMGLPDLHDAIWKGWEAVAFDHRLADRRYLPFTGAYLYGLVLLNALSLGYLWQARAMSVADGEPGTR